MDFTVDLAPRARFPMMIRFREGKIVLFQMHMKLNIPAGRTYFSCAPRPIKIKWQVFLGNPPRDAVNNFIAQKSNQS